MPLIFARIIGRQTCDVYATSIATLDIQPYSMVALTGIYGPNASMAVNATGKITGSFVVKSLAISSGTIKYTSTRPIPNPPDRRRLADGDPRGLDGQVKAAHRVASVMIVIRNALCIAWAVIEAISVPRH